MKRQIRRGTFETNSSSTHSLQILTSSDYDKWCNSDLYLYDGGDWCYRKSFIKPENGHIYTKDEVIAFIKASDYPPVLDFDWEDEDAICDLFRENEFYDSDYYFERDYETFEKTYKTLGGEELIIFGYYGYE